MAISFHINGQLNILRCLLTASVKFEELSAACMKISERFKHNLALPWEKDFPDLYTGEYKDLSNRDLADRYKIIQGQN